MKIKTYYVNKDIEVGPYYEAWLNPHGQNSVEAEGKTEKQAIAALIKAVRVKRNAALKEADYYEDALHSIRAR